VTRINVKKRGRFAALFERYYMDDAIGEAGLFAELLFVRGLAFCAGSQTDGFISERSLRTISIDLENVDALADTLVKVGLWTKAVDGDRHGFVVRSWLDWNLSAQEITDAAARDRFRKRATLAKVPGPAVSSGRNPAGIPQNSDDDGGRNPAGLRQESAGNTEQSNTEQSKTYPPDPPGDRDRGGTYRASARAAPGGRAHSRGHATPPTTNESPTPSSVVVEGLRKSLKVTAAKVRDRDRKRADPLGELRHATGG
jgi:hypothetical protein